MTKCFSVNIKITIHNYYIIDIIHIIMYYYILL